MNPNEPDKTKTATKDIVVFMVRRDTKCAECGKELFDGNLLRMEDNRPLCLDCADLGHLDFSRRATPR